MTKWMHPLAEPLDHAGSSDQAIVLVHGFLGSIPNGADGLRDRLVGAAVEVHWLEYSPHLALLGGEFDEVYDAIGVHMASA